MDGTEKRGTQGGRKAAKGRIAAGIEADQA